LNGIHDDDCPSLERVTFAEAGTVTPAPRTQGILNTDACHLFNKRRQVCKYVAVLKPLEHHP